jgi:signal transduction histidine kinase
LDNAIKFTPQGGRVIAGAEQSGDTARLWVQDEGPGVASDDRPRIFERFYQGRSAQTRLAHDGSGLGLAIVQSIVHAHGGRIIVASELGCGSQFVIELPASARI